MRVVIAEDLLLLREGLIQILTAEGHEVVAAVEDAAGLVDAVQRHRPDVTIADVRLPPGFRDEGLRAAISIRKTDPSVPIMILSQYVEREYARELLEDGNGGIGYLLKDRVGALDEFFAALRRVAAGGTAMDPEVVSQLLRRNRDDRQMGSLTPREREVLGMVAQGLSNGAIATELTLELPSVEKHIRNILTKLDLHPSGDTHRRVMAVLAYLQQGH